MEYTKQELEVLLLAFKILGDTCDSRQSIATIKEEIEKAYIETVMKELKVK